MKSKLKGKIVFFVTDNFNKFTEVRKVLAEYKMAIGMLRVKTIELQSESLIEIAQASVTEAFRRCHLPIMVEDAGLFINALQGFPGPYAAYAYKTLGNAGILKLMESLEDRKATFQSVIAYYDGESAPVYFVGKVTGKITKEKRRGNGKACFGFDPIFQPIGSGKTFAEMTVEEKNEFSHRAKASRKFAKWYKGINN